MGLHGQGSIVVVFGMGVFPFVVAANSSMLLATTESAPQLQGEKNSIFCQLVLYAMLFSREL